MLAGVITIPFHIGDFLSGTMHMDATERGAYIMLLCAHYQAGEIGLPDDDKKLSRIAGVTMKTWSRIKPVMQEKFTVTDGFWRNSKTIDTLQKVAQLSANQRAKALKKHNPVDAAAQPQHSQPKPKPNIKEKINKKEKSADGFFERFWDQYPRQRRGAKEAAERSWTKALTRATEQEILDGLENYRRSSEVASGYAKGAAAWLNDDRWASSYSSVGPSRQSDQSDMEIQKQILGIK